MDEPSLCNHSITTRRIGQMDGTMKDNEKSSLRLNWEDRKSKTQVFFLSLVAQLMLLTPSIRNNKFDGDCILYSIAREAYDIADVVFFICTSETFGITVQMN